MKQKVIEFFQNLPVEKHEQFNEAFKLYRDSPNKNVIAERSYNSSGYTERSLENLMYDLQKLHDVSDVEKLEVPGVLKLADLSDEEKEAANWALLDEDKVLLFQDLLGMTPEEANAWALVRAVDFNDIDELLLLSVATGIEGVSDILKVCREYINSPADTELNPASTEATGVSTEPNPDSTEPDSETKGNPVVDAHDLTDALKIENEELKSENEDLQSENDDLQSEKEELEGEVETLTAENETLKLAPKLDAKQIRVEFPFLKEKDCPDEFKILVADKITAWNNYLFCQEEIVKIEAGEVIATNDYKASLAKQAIEAFDENQKIYDELNCYQTTGKILGVHPMFKKLQLTREIETMTADELIKYKASSAKYFSVKKGALTKAKKAKDTAKIAEIEAGVAERHDKLFLVNKKLGV